MTSQFEVTLLWEIEDGVDAQLYVSGQSSPIIRGNRDCHPDRQVPDEGGELEHIEVRNSKGCRLPKQLEDRLACDSNFLEAVGDLVL